MDEKKAEVKKLEKSPEEELVKDIEEEVEEKPVIKQAKNNSAKLHKIGKDYLVLVDKKGNGIRIPLSREHKMAKIGDTINF